MTLAKKLIFMKISFGLCSLQVYTCNSLLISLDNSQSCHSNIVTSCAPTTTGEATHINFTCKSTLVCVHEYNTKFQTIPAQPGKMGG